MNQLLCYCVVLQIGNIPEEIIPNVEMSLAQVSNNSRREENQASAYTSDEDEDSSMLADLLAMFPSLDHDVIVSVLQAHDGRLQAAVEYLMSSSGADHTQGMGGGAAAGDMGLGPARDMVGQFSDDIGGLPEMLPTFLFDRDERTQSEDDPPFVEDLQEERVSPLPPQDGAQGFIDEPLPTYEEACEGSEIPQLIFPQVHELSASGQSESVLSASNLVNRAKVTPTEDTRKSKCPTKHNE